MTGIQCAPGKPGLPPTWAPSPKEGVGTSADADCNLWFTIHSGIVTELFYPHIDRPAIRDFGLLVADGRTFFSEEKADTDHTIEPLAAGIPGWKVTNTCRHGRYRIEKTILTHPRNPTLLVRTRFEALQGTLADYRLYALLAPHLGDEGADNTGWVVDVEGIPLLIAQSNGSTLAVASTSPFTERSVGFVGVSDGWRIVRENYRLTTCYDRAEDGDIALTGEIDPASCNGEFVLAVGFGGNSAEAIGRTIMGIRQDFQANVDAYTNGWRKFQSTIRDLAGPDHGDFARMSAAVLHVHDAKQRSGGSIASLSTPWGFARGDSTTGGYHVIWPRDQVEGASALLAAGNKEIPPRALRFLDHTQREDGHWPQNMWISGKPYWNGLQLDETALPILLADALIREKALGDIDPYPMVRRAARFILSNGPSTPMDRWEENAGYTPFTLAASIAALLAAADMADEAGESSLATECREKADAWNGRIEDWLYVEGTELADRYDVDGYYVRVVPPDVEDRGGPKNCRVVIKNRKGQNEFPASEIVSPDALALVRFGLRKPDDPRILDTVKVIDATLKTETSTGPVWHRYTHDGYGEPEDGGPFEGAGIGRGWPILAGERAHYELARGNREEAERLIRVLKRQSSAGGMLPEQIWDSDDVPDRGLANGRPSGSAMPLVWAHAEMLRLLRSLEDGKVWDMPPQTVDRYLSGKSRHRKRELAGVG